MAELFRRVRWASRRILRNWPVSLAIVTAIWLGVGANLGLFTIYSSLVLTPEPYSNPEELLVAWQTIPNKDVRRLALSGPVFSAWREETTSASAVEAYVRTRWTVDTGAFGEKVMGARVTPRFFELLGVKPLWGRTFSEIEHGGGGSEVAIVSERLWKRRLGASNAALGSSLTIEGVSYTIIGVLPQDIKLTYPDPTDVWTPLRLDAVEMSDASSHQLTTLARLRPSASIADAEAELQSISRRYQNQDRIPSLVGVHVESLHEYLRGNIRRQLQPGILSVIVIFLVACANIVMLFAAASAGRSILTAMQIALGATWRDLIYDAMIEIGIIVCVGAAMAVASAYWMIILFGDIASSSAVVLTPGVILYAFGLSVVALIVISIWPSIQILTQAAGFRLSGSLHTFGRNVLRQEILLVPQIAGALVFSIVAGAVAVIIWNMRSIDLGFSNLDVLTFQIDLPRASYDSAVEQEVMASKLIDTFEKENRGTTATVASSYPLGNVSFTAQWKNRFSAEDDLSHPSLAYRSVGQRYFDMLGLTLLRGRTFDARDKLESTKVAVINRHLADTFWPETDPLGDSIDIINNGKMDRRVIVGIVADVRNGDIRNVPGPEVYVPFSQSPAPSFFVLLSSRNGSVEQREAFQTLANVDHRLVADNIAVISERLEKQFEKQSSMGIVAASFAAVALGLSVIGIFSASFYWIKNHQFSIAVRMACGATRRNITRWLLMRAIPWIAVSIGLGVVSLFWIEALVEPVLFNVGATDPMLIAIIVPSIFLAALIGAYLPARSASSVNPLEHLRTR